MRTLLPAMRLLLTLLLLLPHGSTAFTVPSSRNVSTVSFLFDGKARRSSSWHEPAHSLLQPSRNSCTESVSLNALKRINHETHCQENKIVSRVKRWFTTIRKATSKTLVGGCHACILVLYYECSTCPRSIRRTNGWILFTVLFSFIWEIFYSSFEPSFHGW